MAMIKGHDYVEISSWSCPHCHKYYGGEIYRIGRSPFPSRLHCNRGCGLEFYPANADGVVYVDRLPSEPQTPKDNK